MGLADTDVDAFDMREYSSKSSEGTQRVLAVDLTGSDDPNTPQGHPTTQLTSSVLRALRKDTASLHPDGRPSMDTMTAQVRVCGILGVRTGHFSTV